MEPIDGIQRSTETILTENGSEEYLCLVLTELKIKNDWWPEQLESSSIFYSVMKETFSKQFLKCCFVG